MRKILVIFTFLIIVITLLFYVQAAASKEKKNSQITQEIVCKESLDEKQSNTLPFYEVTLDGGSTHYVDVDFDGKPEKIFRDESGNVYTYKTNKDGKYLIDVSSEIPYCWIKIYLCCPAHKAYTTINYKFHTIYTEAHYGCSDCRINQYKKEGDTWIEILPTRPLSEFHKYLYPQQAYYWDGGIRRWRLNRWL